MASEKLLERTLRSKVEQKGGNCIKFLPSLKGLPDRVILMPRGRIWFVELKTTGKTPEPLQRWWKRRLEDLGFQWRLIDDQDSLYQFLNEIN